MVTEMQTRVKGKERQLTDAKAQEQKRQHKEEKLRYQLLHQKIQ